MTKLGDLGDLGTSFLQAPSFYGELVGNKGIYCMGVISGSYSLTPEEEPVGFRV